ncbi:BamA/TamA family outer membrane protein [Flavobacterium luteum]|uniref:BamA/TamA family outer membrane protein n=1 Tax=Flavobacterium luteum TaxID=2026654 RepID=A0A7J5AJE5_9FLAO|nr:BamA/TamA family outer membrane protein [Flavobacterium luteum]KAB1157665.1 BamA/TamA family outer membrane protein [Flavobacterium luteum]
MKTKVILSTKYLFKAFLLLFFVFMQFSVIGQSKKDSTKVCPIKSLPEIFKKKDSVLVIKPMKNSFFLIIPIIGVQPANGFMYGTVAQFTFKGKSIIDKFSSVNLGATFTTKNQLLVNLKNNLILNDNKIYLSGDWRYYVFSQGNFGLGTDIIPNNRKDTDFQFESIEEPMKYNYFKFHQTVSFQVIKNLYFGAGLHVDGYTNIVDQKLDVANNQLTNHYNYSKKYGFTDAEYYVNGLSMNMVFDSRDNQVNTNSGWFANINYRINPQVGRNQQSSQVLYSEYRYFLPLSKTNFQHVLAFWTYGQFLINGNVPYLNLPSIGWDQRSRGGKGYTQGLFRGFNLVYFETEYRFPISCNKLLSGTLFSNFTTASNKENNIKLFQYIQPSVGLGLRILIDKPTRTNIIANYGWGRNSEAFYLNAGETF